MPVETPMIGKLVFHSVANAVRTLAQILSLTAASGCAGNLVVTDVEEDAGAIFCTFHHENYAHGGRTVRSTDDGITWNRIYPGGDSRDAVFVCRCRAGLLAELDDDSWYRSTDRGVSWEPVSGLRVSRSSGPTGRGDSEVIYLGTWNGNGVMRSTDGGKTWAPADTAGLGFADIFSIDATPSVVIVVGVPIEQNFLGDWHFKGGWGYYRSTDSGGSWSKMPFDMKGGWAAGKSIVASDTTLFTYGSPWFWYDRQPIIIGARGGHPYRSDDNGISWTMIENTKVRGLFECDSSLLAYVQSDTGRAMLVSTDAGRTWNSHGGPPPPGCEDVQAYPSGKGIFTYIRESAESTIYRSRDRGMTWERMTIKGF